MIAPVFFFAAEDSGDYRLMIEISRYVDGVELPVVSIVARADGCDWSDQAFVELHGGVED
ncbi:hypothetical protein [Spongiibacter marinus]|uniref:hypothetical protein n=1 Tax=Spongiibacter marinus TaxID=354246 RepID=UPI0003FAAA95|nr:hypothetical protein [Spongiibacter marinus]